MNKKISVIIPCYNQVLFLEETLQSVLNQTYNNWECIIIDDGSIDGSKEIALKWCDFDKRFLYFFKLNGGLSSARNAGLKLAKGDYVQFLDGDDLIKSTKFEQQLVDLQDAQVSISNYFSFVDGNIELSAPHRYLTPFVSETNFRKEIILDWEYRMSIPCHSVLFQKKLVVDNGILFNETLPNHEDWVFWTQLFYVSKKIKNNINVLALYRIRNDSMTTNYALMRYGFNEAAKILLYYFKEKKEKDLANAVRIKQNEIKNKNKKPFLKKIKGLLIGKLIYCYKYVKTN
ncbi:glycosyltransferase family 2 protein [Flavobacterium sp. XS1P27]|uniref:glycosyltransferase family 2 protein n=1 Tax=Flavobacterium sp. XS1P27 TaxID=3401724 RepID=UPI003AB03EAF